MKTLIRKAFPRVCYPFSYLGQFIRPGIRVLMYHRVTDSLTYDQLTVSPSIFEKQMRYLSNNFNVISLDVAVNSLLSDSSNSNSVVITFDDGYLDNLENALPVLNKYNLPATIFVTTEFCDQTKSHSRYKTEQNRLHLDWDEVRALNECGNILIGSHTVTHPYLSRINNVMAEKEIKKSKEIIEENLNLTINHFCYPSGDYGNRELEYIKQAGYESAVTVSPGKNRNTISLYEINRTEITQKDTEKDLNLKLNGAFDWMHKVLHQKRKLEFKKMAFKTLD
ncbi:MAG: polysaccharide deacetylase family protein [Thiohalomonadales bacterium]